MEYTNLGRTGLKVSRLCLGTMNFGPQTSEADSYAIMDRALELGINFFDTANVYGWQGGEGVTETDRRALVRPGRRRRDKIVLATKVYGQMGDGPNDRGLSAYHIRQACEDSLRRLQTDHIDLYQMHHVDRATPWEEIWQAMEQLGAAGQGPLRRQQQLRRLAHRPGATAPPRRATSWAWSSEQSLYNLADRTVELEVLPGLPGLRPGRDPLEPAGRRACSAACCEKASGGPPRRRAYAGAASRSTAPQLEAYEELCAGARRGTRRRRAGLAAAQPGRHRADHRPAHDGAARRSDAGAGAQARPTTRWQRLDEIWPGPGGPAPEAYAW